MCLTSFFATATARAAGEEDIPGYTYYRKYLETHLACEYGNLSFRTTFDFCNQAAGLLMPREEPATAIAGDWRKWSEQPPRVCFISDFGHAEREIWDLGRWLEMHYWVIPAVFFSEPPDETTRQNLQGRFSPEWKTATFWADVERERPEVLVLVGANLDALPAPLQSRIAEWVKAGGALVVFNSPGNGGALTDILPLRNVVAGDKDGRPEYARADSRLFSGFKPLRFSVVGKPALLDGLPFDSCPPFLPWSWALESTGDVLLAYDAMPLLAIRQVEKGRVASFLSTYPWVDHAGRRLMPCANPYDHVRFEGYRYERVWMELASRLILWAADREDRARLVVAATTSEPAGRPAVAVALTAGVASGGETVRCRATVFDGAGRRLLLPETVVSAEPSQTGRVLVELPGDLVPPAGGAVTGDLDKIKREEDSPPGPAPRTATDSLLPGPLCVQVEAESLRRHQRYWSGATLRIPATVLVEKLGVDRALYKRGAPIRAAAQVANGRPEAVAATAEWILADGNGRELWREEMPVTLAAGARQELAATVAVPAGRMLATYNTLSLSFRKGRQLLGGGECEVWTPPDLTAPGQVRDWRTMWSTALPAHYFRSYVRDFLGPLGSRSVYTGAEEESVGYAEARYGLEWGQENLMGAGGRNEVYRNHVRTDCFNDPALMKTLEERVRWHLPFRAPRGPFTLGAGEEMGLSNPSGEGEVCICPHCTAALQGFLRERYGRIEELNAAWGATLNSFAEAKPVLREQAMQQGNPAPWLDFRECMARSYGNSFVQFGAWCRAAIPGLPTGVNCTTAGATVGYDYDFLAKNTQVAVEYDCYWPYTAPGIWKSQLLGSRGGLPFVYHGYLYQTEPGVHGAYAWQLLMNGGAGIAIYTTAGSQYWFNQSHGLLVPNGRTVAIREGERDIVNGHGMLVMNTKRIRHAALYYSQRSMNLAEFLAKPDLNKDLMFLDPTRAAAVSGNSWGMFRRLLLDMGYAMNGTFADELKSGQLDNTLPILVLPDALALGSGEIAALRRYVQRGGVLLADLRAGLYTGDGKPAFDRTDLEPLFGFTRTRPHIETATQEIRLASRPDKPIRVAGRGWIKAANATTLAAFADGTPAIVERRMGRGRVLFFNCILQEAPEAGLVRPGPGGAGFATCLDRTLIEFIARRLREHIRPEADLAAPGAEPTGVWEGQETVCFAGGAARYLYTRNVFDMRPDVPVSIVLPQPCHVYDMGTGRYLGRASRVEAPTDRWVKMLALLPYSVAGLRATVIQPRCAPGDTARISARLLASGRCGDHVLRVKVTAPDGRAMTEYAPRLVAANGKAVIELPLALNAVPGGYRVAIEDVATGAAAATSFWVR